MAGRSNQNTAGLHDRRGDASVPARGLRCYSARVKRPCEVQSRLSEALEEATQKFYAAMANRNLALKEKRNIGPHATALAVARADVSRARKKLKAHKQTHACDPQPLRKKI
jgi:hypothetical protein